MSKGILSSLLALLIVIAVIVLRHLQSPDLTGYLPLLEPAIRTMQPQRVIVVEATGAPDKIGKKAFGLLMRAYFGLKGVPKGKGAPAPRARWSLSTSLPPDEWHGSYAMPISDSVKVSDLPKPGKGLSIAVSKWKYGLVAEILHIGPYDAESADVNRLCDFVKKSGYAITGEHEEEYLRGPGMFFKGNPKEYYTIIRYRVVKADSTAIVGVAMIVE
jgi:hypothetical protein